MKTLLAIFCTLALSPLATHAQTVFMGPQGQPMGSAWRMGPQQPCQDDIIAVVPQRRNRVMDDFFDAQERTQRMFQRQREMQEQHEQKRNRWK